jgi:hypothetical protein
VTWQLGALGGYDAAMTEHHISALDLRAGLIDALRAARAVERDILAALDPIDRDAPAANGGWSPKDIQAHLSAWRRHQATRLAKLRAGETETEIPATETDATNAVLHAERADWTWAQVLADADEASDSLIAEIDAADDETISDDRVVGTTLGNGPEHDLVHLSALAVRVGLEDRVAGLASAVEASVDRGGWPPRSAAFARYNLACYHALAGRLDEARVLLRLALPAQEELRGFAPADDDLIALRDELPHLIAG